MLHERIGKYHSKDLRAGRFSEGGRIYLITTVTRSRRRIFFNLQAARCVVAGMRRLDDRGQVETQCFVVMPDHLHWLMQLKEGAVLGRVMHDMKGYAATRIRRCTGIRGPIWQPGYHDHAVRRMADIRLLARYVVANPVRAGLVKRIRDYPHWDAVWL